MTNSKKKCRACGNRKRTEDMIAIPLGYVCDQDCLFKLISINQEKEREKKLKKLYGPKSGRKKGKTQSECENDLKTRKDAAKIACHAYIRERDKGLHCICCGKPLGDDFQAGHYLESGNNPHVRYDENNIHGQRLDCNYFKGGDSGNYEINLRAKIGNKRVDWLKTQLGGTVKRTPQDYKEIELHYKAKLKELRIGQ